MGTAHLFTVVSLLMKAHADDDPVLESTKRIVSLLERVILFPELAHFTDDVRVLLDEAKCQVSRCTILSIRGVVTASAVTYMYVLHLL